MSIRIQNVFLLIVSYDDNNFPFHSPIGPKSDVKLKVTVPGFNQALCQSLYQSQRVILSDRQLCAGGEQGYDSCNGDSGAPLVAANFRAGNNYLVGIVSFGPERCGTYNQPGVYTRIDKYIDWILNRME